MAAGERNRMSAEPVSTHRTGELNHEKVLRVARLLRHVWPRSTKTLDYFVSLIADESPERADGKSHVVWEDEDPIAFAHTFRRTIRFAEGAMDVMALARVCVHPDRQGRGLGAALVRKAFASVDSGVYRVALFQTEIPDFYRKLGAVTVDNAFRDGTADDATASPWWDDNIMIYPGVPDWPAGMIDLNGPAY